MNYEGPQPEPDQSAARRRFLRIGWQVAWWLAVSGIYYLLGWLLFARNFQCERPATDFLLFPAAFVLLPGLQTVAHWFVLRRYYWDMPQENRRALAVMFFAVSMSLTLLTLYFFSLGSECP